MQRGWGTLESPLLQLCEDGGGCEGTGSSLAAPYVWGSPMGVSLPAWRERHKEHWPSGPREVHTHPVYWGAGAASFPCQCQLSQHSE